MTKLVQHLTHANDPASLADLCLCQLQATKTLNTPAALQLAHGAVFAAIKVDRAAVGKAVAQIEKCATLSFQTPAAPAARGYGGYAASRPTSHGSESEFDAGKTLATNAMKKMQPVQEGLLKIAESLVDFRADATKLVAAAEKCPSGLTASLQRQMQTSFRESQRATPCRVNHTSVSTESRCNGCQRDKVVMGPFYKAAAAALYASRAQSTQCHAQADAALNTLIKEGQGKGVLKQSSKSALEGLRRLVRNSPLGGGYSAPQFAGFVQQARPALFASRPVRRALLTPQANPGSRYRCRRST